MRKISRAEEQFTSLNYRTAAPTEEAGHDYDRNCEVAGCDGKHPVGKHPDKHEASTKVAADKEKKKDGFKPPAGVQSAARHALELIEKGKAGDGFTSVGRGRAHQLANGETVSMEVIKKMHSYFARHNVDKKGKDWDNDSPGKVAWLAWGGDAGRKWVNGIMRDHGDKDAESKKKEGSAWPSDAHYEEHLNDLEELRRDTLKGVEWHDKQGEDKEKAKHQQLADDLSVAIDDARSLEGGRRSFKERYAMEKTANQYIKHQGGKWVILNKEGKVLSHHDSKEKAEAAFSAMMANKHKHGNVNFDDTDWRSEYFNLDSDW